MGRTPCRWQPNASTKHEAPASAPGKGATSRRDTPPCRRDEHGHPLSPTCRGSADREDTVRVAESTRAGNAPALCRWSGVSAGVVSLAAVRLPSRRDKAPPIPLKGRGSCGGAGWVLAHWLPCLEREPPTNQRDGETRPATSAVPGHLKSHASARRRPEEAPAFCFLDERDVVDVKRRVMHICVRCAMPVNVRLDTDGPSQTTLSLKSDDVTDTPSVRKETTELLSEDDESYW